MSEAILSQAEGAVRGLFAEYWKSNDGKRRKEKIEEQKQTFVQGLMDAINNQKYTVVEDDGTLFLRIDICTETEWYEETISFIRKIKNVSSILKIVERTTYNPYYETRNIKTIDYPIDYPLGQDIEINEVIKGYAFILTE